MTTTPARPRGRGCAAASPPWSPIARRPVGAPRRTFPIPTCGPRTRPSQTPSSASAWRRSRLRIDISVQMHPTDTGLWQIWFDVPEGEAPPPRTVRRLGATPWTAPGQAPAELEDLCADGFREAVTLARLVHSGGELETGDPRRFGLFLFHALLGSELWDELRAMSEPGATVIELALSCDDQARAVHGVAW